MSKGIPWSNWADFAYQNKVHLVNWAPKGPILSKDFKDVKIGLSTNMLETMVHPRDHQAGICCPLEGEDVKAGVHIEWWSEGQSF